MYIEIHEDSEHRRKARSHSLVPKNIPIYGFIYEVKSDRLLEVKAAMEAGQTS